LITDGIYEIVEALSSGIVIGTKNNEVSLLKRKHSPFEKFFFKYDEEKETYTIMSIYTKQYLSAKKVNGKPSDQLCFAPKKDHPHIYGD